MKSLVISLKENNDARRKHIRNEFDKANVKFEFFDAVTPNEILSVESHTGVDLTKSRLNNAEKSCILSHVKIWKMVVDESISHIAVFEDDIHLSESSASYLSCSGWVSDRADIIKLEKSNKIYNPFCEKYEVQDSRYIYKLDRVNWGSAGYIINNKAARFLLARLSKAEDVRPADYEIFSPCLNEGISTYMLEPALCIQDFTLNKNRHSKFPSTIDPNKDKCQKSKKSLQQKLKRELSRLAPFTLLRRHILSRRTAFR